MNRRDYDNKQKRKHDGVENRKDLHASLTAAQQFKRLDDLFGPDCGAKKERSRLVTLMAKEVKK